MSARTRPAGGAWKVSLGLLVLPIVGAIVPGCGSSSDTPASCPVPASGTIQGTLNAPGDSVHWTIVAQGIHADDLYRESFRGPCDEEGAYTLDLPAGRYRVRADFGNRLYYQATGPVWDFQDADTLTVAAGETISRIDLVLGAVRFDLAVPPALDGSLWSVRLRDTSGEPYRQYASSFVRASNGHVLGSFGSVPPGAYFIHASAYGASTRPIDFWMPFTRDLREADTVRVQPGESRTYRATLDVPAARIRGQIRGSWPRLGVGAPYVTLHETETREVASGETDAFGAFRFDLYQVDRVRVRIRIGEASLWIGGGSFAEAREFVLTPGEEVEVPDYVESAILLTLTSDLHTDIPTVARIRLLDPAGHATMNLSTAIGIPDRVAIPGLPGSTYRLFIEPLSLEHTEWLPQWYDQALTPEMSTPIVVPAGGEVVPVTMRLLIGGRIEGRVLDLQEIPVETFTMVLTAAARDTCVRTEPTYNADGEFRLVGLAEGDYKLGVARGIFAEIDRCAGPLPDSLIWYPGTASWDSAAVIPIRGAQVVSDLVFRLPPQTSP